MKLKNNYQTRMRGRSDYEWLRQQALDADTLRFIETRKLDDNAVVENGTPTKGSRMVTLRFRQGIFHTTRATGHSISHIFVQIFKNNEHTEAPGFEASIKHKVIIDVGANEGYYAMRMAKNTGTKIFSIEPNPIAYKFLVRNVTINRYNNVTTINRAVWNVKGKAMLNILPQVTSIGTIVLLATNFMSLVPKRMVQVPVETISINDIVSMYGLSKVDILKIDIEGGELEALESGLRVLHVIDRIVVEYHNHIIRKKVERLLISKGFILQRHVVERDNFGDLYFTRRGL